MSAAKDCLTYKQTLPKFSFHHYWDAWYKMKGTAKKPVFDRGFAKKFKKEKEYAANCEVL
jgi:hypothetical protein